MATITWDEEAKRFYETGVNHGVLYVYDDTTHAYGTGVAWNGLTAVNESPSGAESNAQYADNIKYLDLVSAEEFGATIEAFYYPDEFAVCDGTKEVKPGITATQQTRKKFCFSYRTELGNALQGNDYGYKIHIIYGCLAAPSEKSRSTINESPEAATFSWTISTTPIAFSDDTLGLKPTSHIVIDSTKSDAAVLTAVKNALYGTASEDAHVLLPDDLVSLGVTGGNGGQG